MDFVEYYDYGYKNLRIYYDLTYLFSVKISNTLDLNVRNLESFKNRCYNTMCMLES